MTPAAKPPITGPVFLFAACIAMLAGAYAFQYIGGLLPCELCYWQRYAYFAAIPLSGFSAWMAMSRGVRGARVPLVLTGLALLAGMGVAGYHAGVEYGWWAGPATCSGNVPTGDIFHQDIGPGLIRCNETPWSLFGVSMAGYNFLISGVLALLAFRLALKGKP